jgi:hypothetical protein
LLFKLFKVIDYILGPATPFEKTNNLHPLEFLFQRMERMDMCDVVSAHESHGFYYFSGVFGSNGDGYFWITGEWRRKKMKNIKFVNFRKGEFKI